MATGAILKPDVFVRQVFEEVSPTLIPPALPVVIIGVNNQIEYKKNAGTYDGTATSYAYPELTLGAIVDTTSVTVFLTNEYGTFEVSSSDYTADADSVDVEANIEITRNVQASTGTGETTSTDGIQPLPYLTDGITTAATRIFSSSSSTFITHGKVPGMQVFLTSGADEGIYEIESVDSETQLTMKATKAFTAFTGATGITFRAGADISQFVDDEADWLDEGITAGMDVVIETGVDAGTYRIEKLVSDIEVWLNIILLDTQHTGQTAIGTTFTDSGKDFTALGVASGDKLVLESGADTAIYVIDTVGTTTLTVTGSGFTAAATGLDYHINNVMTTAQNVNYRIDQTTEDMTGSILIGYTARRTDNIDDLIAVETQDEIESRFGAIVPENPLAFGVWLASLNTDTIVYGTAVAEDEVDDWNQAAEFLEAHEVYSLVPLTQNPAVHQIYSAHVTQMSDWESKHERIVFINRDLFIRETKLEGTDGATDSVGTKFTSAASDFIDSEINPGDMVKLLDAEGEVSETARILRIIDGQNVELVSPGLTPSLTGEDFKIDTKDLDKLEQAEFIRDYSGAFDNRRVYNVWPDEVEVAYSDDTRGDDVFDTSDDDASGTVNGFYAGCIVAGMVANYDPQQPFTNLAMTGLVGLVHSNGYFSPFQLDTMASGGTYIIVQDVPTAPTYCRHQLSTDVSLIEKRELSITKDVDYCAKLVRNTLRPYIGKYNITKVFLEMLTQITNGILNRLIEDGQLIEAKLLELVQDEDQPDTVRITIDILVPYPCNYIRVTLLI